MTAFNSPDGTDPNWEPLVLDGGTVPVLRPSHIRQPGKSIISAYHKEFVSMRDTDFSDVENRIASLFSQPLTSDEFNMSFVRHQGDAISDYYKKVFHDGPVAGPTGRPPRNKAKAKAQKQARKRNRK